MKAYKSLQTVDQTCLINFGTIWAGHYIFREVCAGTVSQPGMNGLVCDGKRQDSPTCLTAHGREVTNLATQLQISYFILDMLTFITSRLTSVDLV